MSNDPNGHGGAKDSGGRPLGWQVVSLLREVGQAVLADCWPLQVDQMEAALGAAQGEAARLQELAEAYVESSEALGGFAIVPREALPRDVSLRAMELLDGREDLEALLTGAHRLLDGGAADALESAQQRVAQLDRYLQPRILHFLPANSLRRERALAIFASQPQRDVPWWYGQQNQCDLLAVGALAMGEMGDDEQQQLREHLKICPACEEFYQGFIEEV